MKKVKILFSLFFLTFLIPLSAQNERETRIFVPPLSGTGYIDDMAYFYREITAEITALNRSLGRTRRASDYVLTGIVMPIAEVDEILPPGTENDENILFLELFDNEIDEVISNQFLSYTWPDETAESLSVIIYNMLSPIPDSLEGAYGSYDEWRNKRLYLNPNFLWVPRVYDAERQSVNIGSVAAEFMVDVHILSFLAVKVGGQVTQDYIVTVADPSPNDIARDMIVTGTAALAFVLRPHDIFMLEPYLGAQINISPQFNFSSQLTYTTTEPYPVSWVAGVQLGVRTGLGIITIDPRFAMDLGESHIVYVDNGTPTRGRPYHRYTISLGFGYKIGFFNRGR